MSAQNDNKSGSSAELPMNEQQCLLAAIWSDEPQFIAESGFDVKGVNVYRRNLLANAERALSISFPTLFELLDSDVSKRITHQFLKSSPPNQGDWAQWGEALASFISTVEIGDKYPYLADCTALDWHIHCALHGVDQIFRQSSLQLLNAYEPEHIIIEFNANVKLLESEYPIADIFYAHHAVDELQRETALNNAQQALASPMKEQIVMTYRPEFQPKVATLTAGEAMFMQSLMTGKSLANALNTVNEKHHFSFENWLVKAIEQNLIYTFKEN